MGHYRLTPALAITNEGGMPHIEDTPTLDCGPFGTIVVAHKWAEPFESDADTLEEALSELSRAANIRQDGWAARYRAGKQRSLSVGDIVVAEHGPSVTYHQMLGVGYGQLDPHDAQSVLVDEPWSVQAVRERREAVS